jgi:membrane-associated phospholipid phosphatase
MNKRILTPPNPAAEYIFLGFSSLLLILELATGATDDPVFRIGVCILTIACVFGIRNLVRYTNNLPVRILFVLYILPLFFLLYPVAIGISKSLHIGEYDEVLIQIDKFIFGGIDPTRWLFTHINLFPIVVELLEYSYFLHYLYALILGTELFLRKDNSEFQEYRIAMVYVALMSFALNMIIPAIGPRFTLHEFADLQKELPGLWLVDWIRSKINTGEGISQQMTSSIATLHVFRDAFPSGHTMFTVATLIYAFRTKARVRWFLLPLGLSLIASTILLRYHYVIDVIAGVAFAIIAVQSTPAVMRFAARIEKR